MRFKLAGDEVLSTGKVTAGTEIQITPANADEIYALFTQRLGYLIDDAAVASAPGDLGAAFASFTARRRDSGLALSSASPLAGAPLNTFLARVSNPAGGAITLTDDGGGRVALYGRNLVAGPIPFVAGQAVNVTLTANGASRTFTLYPAERQSDTAVAANVLTLGGTPFTFTAQTLTLGA